MTENLTAIPQKCLPFSLFSSIFYSCTQEAMFWLRTVPYIRDLGEQVDDLSIYPILFYIFLGLFILFLIIAIVLAVLLHKKK